MFNPERPSIVLVAPEIPGNTGSLGRTCLALDFNLILIKPLAFDISEKAVRRAGLDYWKYVRLSVFDTFNDFVQTTNARNEDLYFFSKSSTKNYYQTKYGSSSFLIFGSETKGLPAELFEKYADRFFTVPMYSDKIRSLNLSNVGTAVAYEVLRQLNFPS